MLPDTYVKSLLHFNGADASTTITDVSGKTWTAGGNAQLDTAQSKFGGSSLLLDGTGDYISTPDHADFFFDGDWTIDFWGRFATLPATNVTYVVYAQQTDANKFFYFAIRDAAGQKQLLFRYYTDAPAVNSTLTFNTSLSTNTWYHFAMERVGLDIRAFQGGTQLGTSQVFSPAMLNFTGTVYVGILSDGSSSPYNGWMDELRVTKGLGRYGTGYSVPQSEYKFVSQVLINENIGTPV